MKRIIALFMAVALLLSLFGCSGFYTPTDSTARERSVVMNFTIDGTEYGLTYELYRYLFLNYKDEISGGDDSVWTGEDKDEYIRRADEIIIDLALDIFATFALCKKVGIDVYSTDIGKEINNKINESVAECDSHDEYRAALKAAHLNDSVQSLLFRYAFALDRLERYYIGATSPEELDDILFEPGVLEYTDKDIEDFYFGDDCRRVLRMHIQGSAHTDPLGKAYDAIAEIKEASSETEVAIIMINNSMTGGTEIENGYTMGRYNLDRAVYADMIDSVFSKEVGDVTDPIVIHDGTEYIYYVIYVAEKSEDHLEANKSEVTFVYLWNYLGELLDTAEATMKSTVGKTEFYLSLDHASISMDEEVK